MNMINYRLVSQKDKYTLPCSIEAIVFNHLSQEGNNTLRAVIVHIR